MLNQEYITNTVSKFMFYTRIGFENDEVGFVDTVKTSLFRKLNIRLYDYIYVEQYGSNQDEVEYIIYKDYGIKLLNQINLNRHNLKSKRDQKRCDQFISLLEYIINNKYNDGEYIEHEYISIVED